MYGNNFLLSVMAGVWSVVTLLLLVLATMVVAMVPATIFAAAGGISGSIAGFALHAMSMVEQSRLSSTSK